MTILNALKHAVNYPLTDEVVIPIAVRRNLGHSDELTTEVANSREYELSRADVYAYLANMVNLSQDGASVSSASAKAYASSANAIYRKYGEPLVGEGGAATVIIGG